MFDGNHVSNTKLPAEADTNVDAENRRINPDVIDAVSITLEAFLGEAQLTVSALNALDVGSVVELSTGLGDAVALHLNGVRIGRGELVAVGDKFAVRITELG